MTTMQTQAGPKQVRPQQKPDEYESSISAGLVAGLFGAAIIGAIGAAVALPVLLPDLATSIQGESPKAYWFLSRTSGWVAFGLLTLSTLAGLLITSKVSRVWPGAPIAFELHEYASLLSLAFTVFHALILLGDRYINYTLVQLVLPFASENYRPEWVGIGQVTFYLFALVTFSFYVRRWITQRAWRLLHYATFVVFGLALAHGLMSGTDSTQPWAQVGYMLAAGGVLALLFYRVLIRFVQ